MLTLDLSIVNERSLRWVVNCDGLTFAGFCSEDARRISPAAAGCL
jgi:hypothetical protein